jgi:hypothetical protein
MFRSSVLKRAVVASRLMCAENGVEIAGTVHCERRSAVVVRPTADKDRSTPSSPPPVEGGNLDVRDMIEPANHDLIL